MTRHTVERRLAALRLLRAMTVHAPAHRERRRRRTEPDEADEVVHHAGAGLRGDGRHALDGPVTRLARQLGADVRLVREARELRHLEDAHPGDLLATLRVPVDLLDLGVVLRADDLVTAETPI